MGGVTDVISLNNWDVTTTSTGGGYTVSPGEWSGTAVGVLSTTGDVCIVRVGIIGCVDLCSSLVSSKGQPSFSPIGQVSMCDRVLL